MEQVNLIYFTVFSAVGYVLFIGAYKYPASFGAKNYFLPISLGMFSIATCLLGLVPWLPNAMLGLVNFCLLGASLSQAMLYRAWRVERSKTLETVLWFTLLGIAILFAALNDSQYFKMRVAIFTCIGFILFFWKTYELLKNEDHRGRMIFVFIIALMTFASFIGLVRFWAIYHEIGGVSQSLRTETVMAMAMKWGYYTLYLLNYIVIFSYYLQISRNKEENAIQELASQQEEWSLLEQKKQSAEKLNQELRDVLAEKTNLLKAVTNESKASALGVLASSIAHEINNPLCAVSLNLEIAGQILEGVDNATKAELLIRDAQSDCLRIQQVVEKLRKFFTRGSSEFGRINLQELIEDTCFLFERELSSNGIEVQNNFTHKDLMVLGDRGQLQMVIINLLSNAVHAMSDNNDKRILRICMTRNGEYADLSFEDNGCGIPENRLDQIFDAHYSSKVQGMGMGLWLVKTIIENHGGSICACNTDHGGAQFNFRLMLN